MNWKKTWIACFVGLVACGGGAGPTAEDVTDLPPGDAIGSDASGSYDLETVTVMCEGSCEPVAVFGAVISPCDVGDRNDAVALVEQTDGALQIDVENVLWASRLEGGIYSDGSFTAGGLKTELGGQIEFIALTSGTMSGGTWTSELTLRSVGDIDGQDRDCTATVEVSGTRSL